MTSYLLTAIGVVFFSIILSFIVHDGKTKKIINTVLKLVCISTLIQPLSDFIVGGDYGDKSLTDVDYICRVYSKNQSDNLKDLIEDEFGQEYECSVLVVYEDGAYSVESVRVLTDSDDNEINERIYAYLQNLGYINITVNDEAS